MMVGSVVSEIDPPTGAGCPAFREYGEFCGARGSELPLSRLRVEAGE